MPLNLGIVGCGRMAYAVIKGLNSGSRLFANVLANDVNSERAKIFHDEFDTSICMLNELVQNSNVILLAVKPQQFFEVLQDIKEYLTGEQLLISIAAGITSDRIEKSCKQKVPVIRVMPNTPCLIGTGVSVICSGSYASEEHMDLARSIFERLGTCLQADESKMDAVTALSGSGPAYAYLVTEALINAGIQVGLDTNLARELVLKTIKGSINMIEETGVHPAVLREQVCSPAGTTIAAVRKLEENGIRAGFFEAVEAAYLRSIELGKY